MESENKNLKSTASEVKELSEEILKELESTEVSGGQQPDQDEDSNYFQCYCQNHQCTVKQDDGK